MKEKIVLILAILLMAAPAMATVNFAAADAGSGQLRISYTCDAGEEPRGIALKVTLTGGTIEGDGDVVSKAAEYNTYIDWAHSNPAGYAVGDGNPLADPTGAGVPTYGTGISEVSVCMGVLDETGNQLPGPGTCADLVTIQLHGPGGTNVGVVVAADLSRAPDGGSGGGAVGSTLATNLPLASVDVAIPEETECMMATHPDYTMWGVRGKPDCWCYLKQCNGDADGKTGPGVGPFPVSGDDLTILAAGINKIVIPAGSECADFDHKNGPGVGPFPVSGDDLTILAGWINKLPGPPACDGTHINEWLVP